LSLDTIKKDMLCLGISFVVVLLFFKIVFYDEEFIILLKLVASIFFQFVVPGFFLTYMFFDKPGMSQKFILGIGLMAVFSPILSYYLGIIGLNIKFHWPIFIILALLGIYYAYKSNPDKELVI